MASDAQVQAALDPQGTGMVINILKSQVIGANAVQFYCLGISEGCKAGRWVTVDSSQTAAQQAAAIRAGMA